MKQMKRMLALLLALVMIVGVLPLSVFADEYGTATGDFDIKNELVDAAIVFTDLHTSKNDYKQSTVAGIMGALKATGLPFSSVTSGGDAFSVNEDSGKYTGKTSTITGYIRDALGNSTIPVNYAWSDHDRYALQEDDKTLLDKTSHLVYGAGVDGIYGTSDDGNYYVYVLSMADLSTKDRYNAGLSSSSEVQKAIENFKSDAEKLLKDRPLLIVSHQPLLDRRNDNGHAYDWALAINEVAEDMDVAFFHGHNHNYDKPGDYYYPKGSTMSVCSDDDGDAESVELNFAHITAGYLDPKSTGSTANDTRMGVAVAVEIYERTIKFVLYDKNGVYTGDYALNETVDRDHADANVPKSLAVTGKIDYTVGDAIVEPTEVKVTYMSGDTAEAENYKLAKITKDGAEVTLVDNKFAEAGEYVLTYTCTVGNYQAQAELKVTVAAAPAVDEEEKPEEIKLPVVAGANVTEVKDVTAEIKLEVENVTNYVAYDIVAEMTGDTAMVSIPVPSDWVVGELKAYYVDENGNLTDESFDVSYVDGYATFTVTHFSTYALTNTVAELNWIEISKAQEKTIFRLTNSLDTNKNYVIVNRNTAGSGNAVTRSGSSSAGTASVTVIADANGNYIDAPATNAQWKYTLNKNFQSVSSTSSYLRGRNSTGALRVGDDDSSYITWNYDTTYGLYGNNSSYNVNSSFSLANRSSSNRVYIYVEDTLKTAALFAAMDGQTEFRFTLGAYTEEAIRKAIAVYTATDSLGTGMTPTQNYQLAGNVQSGVEDTYTLTVRYGGKDLGTITVAVSNDPYLKITENGEETELVYKKNVKVNDTVQLGVLAFTGIDMENDADVTWSIPEEYAGMATVDSTGEVTFLTDRANFMVKASWTVNGQELTDTIQFIITPDNYLTPGTSTNDFPEYPNQGAIRYDKTATAVGSFSETGVTQVELSMTGIPYGGNEQFDIVLLLDRSSSMSASSRLQDTRAAAKAFVEAISKKSDGSWTGHNILIADYHGGKMNDASNRYGADVYTTGEKWNFTYTATYPSASGTSTAAGGFQTIESDAEITAIETKLNSTFVLANSGNPSGTDYDHALQYAQAALKAARDAGSTNKQFVVMMTDGVPTHLRFEGTLNYSSNTVAISGSNPQRYLIYGCTNNNDMKSMFLKTEKGTVSSQATAYDFTNRGPNYRYEVISDDLKAEGVTIYTVGLGLFNTNSAWDYGTYKASANDCGNAASLILNDISGPAYETTKDTGKTMSKADKYFFNAADGETDKLIEQFVTIASKISEAAVDIVVTDKISNEYTMIFGVPQTEGTDDKAAERNAKVQAALANQDLYIEVVNYTLDAKHERSGNPATLTRIYLKDSNGTAAGGTYSAATNASGTAAPDLTFKAKEEGKKAYWSRVASAEAGENDIVINVDGTYWKFIETGDGTHNVASGAYAYGTIHEKTNMSDDLVIVTPYFAYSAKTKILAWTVDKVEEFKEIALRYFLFLDDSSTEIGTDNATDPGTYDTNEWAYITYTNHLGNECRQEFPVPHMTWNGAQVSYVFYLVNANGDPINKAGEKVDFANAVFITDIFTEAVVWNDTDTPSEDVEIDGELEGVAYLDAQWMASSKLPEGYELYDNEAYYELKVYEDHEGNVLDNYFKIEGAANKIIDQESGETTTKVYITKAGEKYSKYGYYTGKETDAYEGATVLENFDFANTTVAFAVVWELQLVEDTVVVDFGLDVLINVVQNDLVQNTLTGISKNVRNGVAMDTGVAGNSAFTSQSLNFDDYVFSVEGENQIRFHQKNMQFDAPAIIYYETKSIDYINGTARTAYMYSRLTVIPATTIYYEDSFLTFDGGWTEDGTKVEGIQQQDRPGPSQISAALDADNNYGYDAAYSNMSQYSMGSAHVAHVDADSYATATFTFYGTGFDIIGLTSNTTGTIAISIKDANGNPATDSEGKELKGRVVDTYYGYKYENGEWVITNSNDPNALYQVPVMKASGLPYGQYTVTIIATYVQSLDHTAGDGYDLYLDAVRIYDPANDGANDKVIEDAYNADGEGWPEYFELRNQIISKNTFNSLNTNTVNGIVFIDGNGQNASIADYISYGPNNELYLDNGQAVAFNLNGTYTVPAGKELAKIQLAIKTVGGTGKVEVYGVLDGKITSCLNQTISTATDMYYDITKLEGMTVVIKSTGEAIVSITNVKVTYKTAKTADTNADNGQKTDLFSVNASSILGALLTLKAKEPIVMPNVPAEPELPVLPEQPVKPVQPIKPGKPVQPGKPIKPVKPVQPVQPVLPGKPVQPNKPVQPVLPGKPALPGSNIVVAIY